MQDQAMALSRRFLGLSADKRRLFLEKLAQQGMSPAALPMPSGVAGETSPASYAQQRLWFIEQMTPGNSAYHLPGALALDGPVDEQALHAAFQALAQRHASLRTTFSADDSGQPLQHVRADINVSMASWQVVDDDVRAQRLQAFVESPFDWEQGPLWRVALVEQAPQQYQLWLCVHHVIADGWSIQVLLQDFAQAYQQVLAGAEHVLGDLDVDYADYALWQRALLEAGAGQEDLDYWRQQLGETPPVLDLPWDHPRPAHPEMRGGRRHFHWSQALSQTIQQRAQQAGTTAFTVLLSAFKVWLYRMSGQPDLAVGVPMAGRDQAELAPLIGFFVNTQVLRDQFTPAHTFQQVLAQVNATSQAAQAHQMLPFEHLVEHLQPERSLNHNPLFQVLYNHQQREQESLQLTPELTATLLPHEAGNAQFDLALHTWTLPSGEIGGNWHYAADLLDADTIDRWHTLFEQLLTQLLAEPDRPIGDIALISPAERQQLAQWNDTAVSSASDDEATGALTTLVPRRFEQQVQAHPDRIALTVWPPEGTPTQLSYAELDRQANALAHELIARGVQPEDTVAVAMERSVALVVALYAIIKAGAAYVPVDPAHPQARQQRVIEQSGTRYLLTHQMVDMADYEAMVPARVTVLHWASLDLSARPTTVPDVTLHPQQQAYVIFTSGSTGLPKGVANTHDALLNRLQWMQQAYPLSAEDKVLQKTPYSFDVSVWEFFWPLMVGAELVVAAPGAHQDPAQLHQVIEQSGISVLHFVPSMLSAFVNHLTTDSSTSDVNPSCSSLKHVICSGEALPKPLQTLTLAQLPHIQLHNLYGPTEAAIDVTHWTCQPDDPRAQVPIGQPITRLQIHILDPQLNPQPIGVPGELYIGGIGLARGYHGQPGLTAERFIPNPFIQNSSSDTASSAAGERLYRTGDLARWCADGTLEYLGRLDHQIKLRGLRIELGEIEAVMASFPGVTESVVVARDDQLVGYVAPKQGLTEPDLTALRQHLEAQLPSYMVPTHLMALDQLPLSANGKLDRNALPEPVRQEAAFEAPEGPVETTLAALWAGVLHLEAPVGRQDNFFALGGDSILSLRVIAQAQTHDWVITPRDIFEHQTLAALARQIEQRDHNALQQARAQRQTQAVTYEQAFPLTPIQHRFWSQPMPEPDHWNQSVLLIPDAPLHLDALGQALQALVRHHDALRLRFDAGSHQHDPEQTSGQWYQAEASHEDLLWHRVLADDASTADRDETMQRYFTEVQQSLNLHEGPLLRALYLALPGESDARLLLVIHHLAVDGVSWRILLEDLAQAYQQALHGQAPQLAPVATSFQYWALQLQQWCRSESLLEMAPFWQQLPAVPVLPGCDPEGANTLAQRATIRQQLSVEQTQALLSEAPAAFRTQINDLLLAALGQALSRWRGQGETLIALESHGREALFEGVDLSRTVGWLTSLYPVALPGSGDLAHDLKTLKERLRSVPHGGLGFGVLRELKGEVALPDVADMLWFNYLGQTDLGQTDLGQTDLGQTGPGQTDLTQTDSGLTAAPVTWQRASEAPGQAMSLQSPLGYEIAIEGEVTQGQLRFSCHFSQARYPHAEVDTLMQAFMTALDDVLALCRQHVGVTPSDFPWLPAGFDQAALDALPVPAADLADLLPLTPMQQGLFFHSQWDAQTEGEALIERGQAPQEQVSQEQVSQEKAPQAYMNQVAVTLEGVTAEVLAEAWTVALKRYPVLRAAFLTGPQGQPVQWIPPEVPLPIQVTSCAHLADADAIAQVLEQAQAQAQTTPFAMDQPPLMRWHLMTLPGQRCHMIWTFHHILLDGWSSARLLSEVMQQVRGQLLSPAADYRPYFQWLSQRQHETSERFWRAQLATLTTPTFLAPLLGRQSQSAAVQSTAVQSTAESPVYEHRQCVLDQAALTALARDHRVTLNTLVQAAWALLLQRYTGQAQVTFGVTVAGRPAEVAEIDRHLGLLINTLPLMLAPGHDADREGETASTLAQWWPQLQQHNLDLREHDTVPLYQLQQWAGQASDQSFAGQSLFDTLLVFENFPVDEALRAEAGFSDLTISEHTHYPVSLAVEVGAQLVLHLHTNAQQVASAEAEALLAHLQHLLDTFVDMPDQPLDQLSLLTADDQAIWQQWNTPCVDSADEGRLSGHESHHSDHERPALDLRPLYAQIQAQAQRRPEAVALVEMGPSADSRAITFAQLTERANRLAHWLIAQGVQPDSRVGVALNRGIDLFVTLLAVHQAGGAYVPLDPDYPLERLSYMLSDAGAALLLTHTPTAELMSDLSVSRQVNLDALDLADQPTTAPDVPYHPQQLAYLIYTSGSTGQPKGVAVAQGDLAMHCQTIGARYQLISDDRELHFLSISFDGAHERWLTPLSYGARIVIRDQRLWSVQETYDCLIAQGITVAAFPPSYLRQLAQWAEVQGRAPGVHTYCFAGEAFSREMMQHAIEHLKPQWIINGYGPTETVVTPTLWRVAADKADFHSASAPIGDLVGVRQGYVLDGDLNLLPPGVAGELYLGGALARGYLDRPAQTAERFVPNPFRAGERLYRTGDRVRLNRAGQLEYLGRMDQQIKLRGFRIELGEIEAALAACDGVDVALVVLKEASKETGGGSRLVAYVQPKAQGQSQDQADVSEAAFQADLQAELRTRLPSYMMPTHWVVMAQLPTLPNGKLDRRSLPEPLVSSSESIPPQTVMEQRLATLWCELLAVESVGRNDHFFDLGGHSLLATQLVSRLRHEWGLQLPLRQVFESPCLADLAAVLDAAGEVEQASGALDQIPARHQWRGVQSFAQQRLWFLHQLSPNSSAYHLPGLLALQGALDIEALQRALTDLSARHHILRTGLSNDVPLKGMPPQQVIEPVAPIELPVIDLRAEPEPATALKAQAQQCFTQPFSLDHGPLWRVQLVRLGETDWRLLLCMHHALSDGASVPILLRDLNVLYRQALGEARGDLFDRSERPDRPELFDRPELPELPIQYLDFAHWQREWLAGGEGQRQLAFWHAQLGDHQPVLALPYDRPRPARPSEAGARLRFTLAAETSQALVEMAAQQQASPFMVLLTVYQLFLARLSGQTDIRVGVPMAGRQRPEVQDLIGLFVNTQVMRGEVHTETSLRQQLAQTRDTVLAAQEHQDLPFEQLVEALQPERDLSLNPLFQVMLDYQQAPTLPPQWPGLDVNIVETEDLAAQFDLALNIVAEADGRFTGDWHYATDLLDADTIDRWHILFEQLLTQLLAEPDRPIGDIALISPAERQQLAQWNDTAVLSASNDESTEALTTLVPRRFEQQVQAHPDRIALTVWPPEGTPTQLSYAELDRQANALAHELIARGVQPEDTVAVAMERSVALVVALYAIIKAGAAYVPVDPAHPQARQQRVIEQSGTRYLLTHHLQSHQAVETTDYEAMVPARVTVLHWTSLDLSARPTTVPDVTLHPQQQAYVIFTSGSTGLPKGVANTHDALLNRLQWMQQAYPLSAEDKVLQKTPYSFDVSVWEFFWPLMVGAELVVAAPGAHQDPAQLHQVIEQSGISVLHFVPSMLSAFVNHLTTDSSTSDLTPSCSSLKHVICSGEALPKPLQTLTLAQLPHIQLHNLYGPTEAAIDVTHWTCQPDDPRAQVPIGRPITRLQIHILDPQLNPQPIGVPGELYIGGIGLARGYHGQPGLTAERFIPNPFIQNSSSDTASSAAGERLYRTGDLARWCADGTLEYLGRLDHQIKLRGLRIELGEIEAVMASFPGVTESVVVARDDQLVGYVAPKLGLTEQDMAEPDLTALRQHLEAQLPSYMVPTHLMALDQLPLSANGKLDRNALPEPVRQEAAFEAPEGPVETTLAALWAGVLHLEVPVGRQDNFFALGGHSLLGVTLVHQIEATFGITLSLGALFETHTLADLAAYIAHCDTALPALKPRPKPEYAVQAPQSFAQQRLWFLAQLTPDSVAYHLPAGLSLSGDLDPDALQRALDRLVAHHEILRTRFMPGDLSRDIGLVKGEASHEAKTLPQQQILPDFRMPLVRATVTPEAFEAYQAEVMQTPFDLEEAPPWRAHLVRLSDDQGADSAEWRLLLCVHHILADGWSLQRFLTAWVAAYREELLACEERAAHEVSRQADLSYADYALWQRTQLDTLLQDQLAWWRTTLTDDASDTPVLALPMDRPRPAERDGRGARYGFELPSTLAERLRQQAKAHRVSLFTLILAGFEAWLYRVTGQADLRVGIPVAGRDQPGTAEIMGCFVNTLVLRTAVTGALTGIDLLQQVQQRMRGAQAHADLPFEQLVEALQPERSLSVNPLFQVSYNHQVLDQSALSQLPGVTARPLTCPAEQAHFDLVLGTQEYDTGQLTGYLDYATDILEADTVARMGAQIMAILTQFSETLETPLHQLALLSEADQAIWQQWNTPCVGSADEGRLSGHETRHSDHERPALDPRPLYAQIQAQAQRRPEAVALVEMGPSADSREITFAQLTERANRLAHWLIAQGVKPDSRVGVALNRGIDLFVTLLAVHQAGGAYVPLDPDYPLERLSYMLSDAGAALLLTHTPTAELMRDLSVSRQVNLDTLDLADQPTTAPDVPYHPQQLAYLIYTSGSTGQPKGVAVAQGDLAMHCQTIGARYQLTPDDRELHFLSISFDGAHERWLTPLSYGARIVIRDQRLWSVQETYDCLIAQGITVAAFPPSYLRQLAQWAEMQGRAPGVHTYCFAGEAFSREMMQHAIEHLKPKWIINGYGPTETVVTPTLWRVAADEADFHSASAPIGDLVGVRQGYVLDGDLNLLPPGVAGELYLGGALARGYLDRPAQTAERFVPNPFRVGERLYRTGDRVRLNRAGQLEYLGRMDQQIKLRGFRIELGEIEAALAACDGVDVALVVLKEASKETGGGSRLVAYVQPKAQGQSQDQADVSEAAFQADLQAELRTRLPSYMMPTHWVVMAQLPTLPNGKLDRQALPEPVVDQVAQQVPEGEQECLLAELWQALLGDVAVYRESHFFELGGDSIQSLGLITQLRQAGWSLTPKDIFAAPQLSAMAAAMRPFEGHDETSPVADSQGGQVLTPIQAHFFSQQSELIETLGADAAYQVLSHWNQALLLTVKRPLTAELMTAAVEALLQQHDVLRLTFQEEAQAPHGWQGRYQRTMATESVFQVATLTDEADITPYCETVQAGLDLTQGPLVAIRLIQLPNGAQRLLMVLHHLLVDGVSWRLLLGDLARAYQQAESGLPVVLPSSSTSYQQWAHQLQRDAESGLWAHERAYWRAQTRTEDAETTAWPVTWPEGRSQQQDLVHCQWSLTPSQTEHLLRATLKYYDAGIESLLLTALTLALKDWGAIEQPHIVMESHGRDGWRDAQDVSHTVGWFTALYPLRLPKADTLLETLSRIQQHQAAVPGQGQGFGALRYYGTPEDQAALQGLDKAPLVFNYLGQFDLTQTDERFQVASESMGACIAPQAPWPHEVEINGQIHGGQLTLNCRYSDQRYPQAQMEDLLARIGDYLQQLMSRVPMARSHADKVEGGSSSSQPSKLNPLLHLGGPAKSATTLFCPHPVSGTVVGYYTLARYLPAHWSVWGMQNRQLQDRHWRDVSLEDMARDYVKALLAYQPQGPYYLVGWSMGGALVLEMAALLERLGQTVAFVGLVDGYVPGAGDAARGHDESPLPDDVAEDEWQQLMTLERHMRTLARQHRRIRPIQAPVHAWWAMQSPENNEGAEARLTAALGQPLATSVWLDTDHLGIIRHADLLSALTHRLEASGHVSSTSASFSV